MFISIIFKEIENWNMVFLLPKDSLNDTIQYAWFYKECIIVYRALNGWLFSHMTNRNEWLMFRYKKRQNANKWWKVSSWNELQWVIAMWNTRLLTQLKPVLKVGIFLLTALWTVHTSHGKCYNDLTSNCKMYNRRWNYVINTQFCKIHIIPKPAS